MLWKEEKNILSVCSSEFAAKFTKLTKHFYDIIRRQQMLCKYKA